MVQSPTVSEQRRHGIRPSFVPLFTHLERAANRPRHFLECILPMLEGLDVVTKMLSPAVYHGMMVRALAALKRHPKRVWKATVQYLRGQARSRGLNA